MRPGEPGIKHPFPNAVTAKPPSAMPRDVASVDGALDELATLLGVAGRTMDEADAKYEDIQAVNRARRSVLQARLYLAEIGAATLDDGE